MGKTSVVIVNFNSDKDVFDLVAKIFSNPNLLNIFVINNSETSPVIKSLESLNTKVVVYQNSKNVGFAAGANIGIKKALETKSDRILLLNPDLIITNRQIDILCDNSSDIVGPVLKFRRQGKSIYDYGGRIDWILGRSFHQEFESIQKTRPLQKTDYLSGACMLINKGVLETIGLLDERFFMYFEDVDFCLRAKRANFSIEVELHAIVEHVIDEHKYSQNKFKIFNNIKSNKIFIEKWSCSPYKFLALLYLKKHQIKNILVKYA